MVLCCAAQCGSDCHGQIIISLRHINNIKRLGGINGRLTSKTRKEKKKKKKEEKENQAEVRTKYNIKRVKKRALIHAIVFGFEQLYKVPTQRQRSIVVRNKTRTICICIQFYFIYVEIQVANFSSSSVSSSLFVVGCFFFFIHLFMPVRVFFVSRRIYIAFRSN